MGKRPHPLPGSRLPLLTVLPRTMTTFENRTPDWLTVGEALERVLARAMPLEREGVPLQEAVGRALSERILAGATLPPWDNAAMDGYAVRGEDVAGAAPEAPVTLRVVGETRAGAPVGRGLERGEAIRIMTGAPVPPGADSVIRVEHTDAEETPGQIRIHSGADRGGNIRPGGQDMVAGEELLPSGFSIGPGTVGLLAAAGVVSVPVRRRPRIAILSNGDELAEADAFHRVMAGRAIPETNAPTLTAAVTLLGGIPIPLGIARDNPDSILEGVGAAREARADVLLTSGGASMGEHDLLKRVLDRVGFELDFWRVRMRPGTPFSFGLLPVEGGRPMAVFGLPGNPASSFVTFQIFCRPFLLRLAGHHRLHRPVTAATTEEDLRSPPHLTHFFRVDLSGEPGNLRVRLTGSQTSGLVRGQALARALAVVPEGVSLLPAGEEVRVLLLDDLGLGEADPGYLPV